MWFFFPLHMQRKHVRMTLKCLINDEAGLEFIKEGGNGKRVDDLLCGCVQVEFRLNNVQSLWWFSILRRLLATAHLLLEGRKKHDSYDDNVLFFQWVKFSKNYN